MATQQLRNILLAAAFLGGVAACGGGSQLAGGGIGGTGISQGPITQFGSIFVNGVEFNTVNATIIKDGIAATQNDLRIGMVVTVDGDIASATSGTAVTVTYAKELEGPITSKTANTLSVLGQTVIVDNLTQIEKSGLSSPTIDNLSPGETVEVSGALTTNGIRATYIEVKSPGADVELKGTITSKTSATLTIGGQLVDFSAVTPSFTPAIGDYVEVKGTLAGTTLAATSLELQSRNFGDTSKEKAELQGYVTSAVSATDFVLDAQPVHTDSQTKFNGGIAADIKAGLKLEVEGALVNGTLNATKVNFEDGSELEGNIASIDPANGILTLDSYPGIDISYNNVLTEAEGGADLNTLAKGKRVKIRGRKLDGACTNISCMLATQLELESGSSGAGSTALLQGKVDAIAGQLITILGVVIDTSIIPSFGGDGVTNSTDFFNKLKLGSLVEVHGTRDAQGNVTWDSIDLDD